MASARAGQLYGLEPLDVNIQDNKNNITRFLILSRDPRVQVSLHHNAHCPRCGFHPINDFKGCQLAVLVSLKSASFASKHGLHLLQSPSDTRMCKTSVVFSLKEGPGELFKACSVFALRGLNMTNIESRPMRMGTSQASSSSSKNGGFRCVLCF